MIYIKVGSEDFPGFYESIFYSPDMLCNEEELEKDELESLVDGDIEVNVDIIKENWNEYQKDICEAYLETYIDEIISTLPYEITEHENFLFEVVDEEDIRLFSPTEYNYRTDQTWRYVKTNFETLQLIKDHTLQLNGVQEYMTERFTSYDGYISFLSNKLNYWKNTDIKEYEENMISALLDMMLYLTDIQEMYEDALKAKKRKAKNFAKELFFTQKEKNNIFTQEVKEKIRRCTLLEVIKRENKLFEISRSVAEDISIVCYLTTTVTYNGKKYSYHDFREKFGGE